MDNTTSFLIAFFLWMLLLAAVVYFLRFWSIRSLIQERLAENDTQNAESLREDFTSNPIRRWLYISGYRNRNVFSWFLLLTFCGLVVGSIIVGVILWSGVVDQFAALLQLLPGGVGEVFLPIAWMSPWFSLILLTAMPTLVVRSQRRQRVQMIEQDLPLTLDLLSTLAEAGLSFDSALDRILDSQPQNRPLANDFRLFQIDVLAGRGRIESLRRLMQRVEVAWFSIFISAIMHAEQVGSSLASTLRTQAEDLRIRRRERAMALAMRIPVKLLFPLIVCFLPGIMTAALGPVVYQIVQVLDSFLRGSLGG